MGTRSLICVVKDKEYKLAQYNQWDGYQGNERANIQKRFLEHDISPNTWETHNERAKRGRIPFFAQFFITQFEFVFNSILQP